MAKGVVGWLALPAGLPGWYYDNSRFQGDFERSTDYLGEPWTRREREVYFGGDEFPTYFMNDVQRYNFYGAEVEKRRNIPFSVRWEGTLYAPADGAYQLWLTASGPGVLRLDGKQIAAVDAEGRETAAATVQLTQGSHPIRITYARRPPRSPDLKVEWDLGGQRQALAVPYLFPSEVSPAQWSRDRTLLTVSWVLDALYLIAVGAGLFAQVALAVARSWRDSSARWPLVERALLGSWMAAIFLRASVPRLDRVDKLTLLGGGQDWLTHETFARDILIGGPLMTLGKPLGEGRTFYAQPFYPYALAAMHALTGEDQFGVVALQLFGSAVAVVLTYFLARRLFGVRAALATFALLVPLWAWHLKWVSERLISEAIYFVILPALLLVLVRCLDERRRTDFALAGLLLGLAIVTRGPTLLYVPLVGMLLWWGLRRAGLERVTVVRQLALLALVTSLVVGLVPLRNALVAGQPALLASSGGVNLQKLHRPTNGVRLSLAQDRWFAPYIQDAPTRETVEFMLQDPVGWLQASVLLAEYTLGYGAAVEESQITVWPELILFNLLYLAALLFLARARSPRSGLLHAFVLVHFATMVVFVPYDYDNRLVLPMYLPIVVFGGYAISEALGRLFERVRGGIPKREMRPATSIAPTRSDG
ncbi:MAG: glycosyltransferase family 39 protein [Chloroflexota bacterium]